MKTRGSILAVLLMILLINTANAQEIRINSGYVDITFSGTTANCYAEISGNKASDKISATIELRCGNQTIRTWNVSDDGSLSFYETVSVTKGKTYELVVECTVNGKAQSSFSDSGTCK